MEVTSIRLERELKDRLKELAGSQSYQALVRDILWNYVQYETGKYKPQFSQADIRATIRAQADREERCALTGVPISPNAPMLLGWTRQGNLVPLSPDCLDCVTA